MNQTVPVAVVGLGAFTPGAADVAGFWRTVLSGRDMITDVPSSHWLVEDYYDPDPSATDKTYGRRGAFLDPVSFDPLSFGVPPKTVQATDTTQLLALMVAESVLRDFGSLSTVDRERVSVILGAAPLELLYNMASRLQRPVWLKSLREAGIGEKQAVEICDRIADHYVPWQEASFPGMLSNVIAGRIANRFDLHGTNCTTDAACASSLAAVSGAVNELSLGVSDLVVTGGVDTLNDILMYMCFSKTPALSATGDCRPFSDAADGTMLGEGLVMFALKRLDDAERDGDKVYAVIRGIGTASDGKSTAIYAPLPAGQSRALTRAYEAAGYGPETVELVEAHGTGTVAGDAAEFAALRSVFSASGRDDTQWCALGSVKSQIGHTKAAAGAAGMLKAVLSLQHGVLPPTIKVDKPNPALDLSTSPLYLNTEARPWVRGDAHPRRASVSSFGFGGSNFHLALEEYTGPNRAWRSRSMPAELVLLSASSADELVASARSLSGSLTAIARASQTSFDSSLSHRLAVVTSSVDDLRSKVDKFASCRSSLPGVFYASGPVEPGSVAFLFPGQGSQYVGMGAEVAMHFPEAAGVWDQAADLGLHRLVFPVPVFSDEERAEQESRLTATECAQSALALTSLSLLSVLSSLGITASAAAGHSFGELVALHYAGAFSSADLLALAQERGSLMRDAASSSSGAMLAVTASLDEVTAALDGLSDWWVANHNSPTQVIISGTVPGIEACEKALGAFTTQRLNTSTAFHSPVVAAASSGLASYLSSMAVSSPSLPVYGNFDAAEYPADPDEVRSRVASHLATPVRFVDSISAMYAAGVRTFIEVGAGSTVSRLAGQILGEQPHLAVSLDRKGRSGVTSLFEALGQLAIAGVPVDFAALWAGYAPEPVQDDKPRMTMPISGANYDRPYPPVNGAAALPPPNPDVAPAPVVPVPVAAPVVPVAPAPAPVPVPVAAVPAEPAWLTAYQDMQRQTAEVHAAYQKAMTESHLSFLRTSEASLQSLSTTLDGTALPQPTPAVALTAPAIVPAAAPVVPTALPEPAPVIPAALATPPAPVVPTPPPVTTPPPADLHTTLLSVVSDKTGYPADMLDPSMELESDLGIDSIKRVEILSTLRERAPHLPEVDVAALGKLRTLGEIADVFDAHVAPAAPAAASPTGDLQGILLGVVSDKTGYPAEMLDASMELETDLGIDSIKRVEILSALREKVPGLPEVPVSDLGKLRTLGQITEALNGGAGNEEPEQKLTRQVVKMVPHKAPGLAVAGLGEGRLVVTDDGGGIADEVVARLAEHDVKAEVVQEVPQDADGVIFLGGLKENADLAVNHQAFKAAQAVADKAKLFVTVQDTGGDFGLGGSAPERVWAGGVAGLARCAHREWPNTTVKIIDCPRDEHTAERIVRELREGGDTLEVGLTGERRTVVTETEAAREGTLDNAVIVATGGARGVTAKALEALARRHQPKIVLIGRTPLEPDTYAQQTENELKAAIARQGHKPKEATAIAKRVLANREIRQTIADIERAGSKVQYRAVDVTDERELAQALEAVRGDWGPITGIVHGAGVLADRRIADQTDEQYDFVVDTKVKGLKALLKATENDPITHLCLFSSVAARQGNVGQSAYAIANEVLNQVASAEQAKDPAKVVSSIGWGAWDGGMVTPELARHFHSMGVPLIPIEEGAEAFVREFTSPGTQVVIAPDGAELHGQDRTYRAEAHLTAFPQLVDHTIENEPVVPIALALEWFAAGTGHQTFLDVTVLRKITAKDGKVTLRGKGNTVELTTGTPHYRAVLGDPSTKSRDWTTGDDEPVEPRYDGFPLFHGPAFQAITSITRLNRDEAAATVAGAAQLGWNGDHWRTDPAAVDACLQLALLWGKEVFGGNSLPMSVREVRLHTEGLITGTSRAVLKAGQVHDGRAECDVALVDATGEVRAELFGISIVRRPQ